MKIAIFYNLHFSGAKRTVYEHTKGLSNLGHTVDIYTTDTKNDIFDPGQIANKEYRYKYGNNKINIPIFKKISSDLSDYFFLKDLHRKIARDIDEKKYDIALVHTDLLTQAPYVLRYLKTKNVYFCLEPLKMAYEYSFKLNSSNLSISHRFYELININIRKKIDRDNARASDSSLSISSFGRELMIEAFDLYPKVSYLGVDINIFKKKRINKKNQILFIGQKIKMNGYDYALEAIKLISKDIRPKLKVISISENKHYTDDEIVKFYNESLITLSLSNFDTFGLVPLESFACGTPVIAFNVAGYRETVVNNENGFLVDFSAREIANKINLVLREPQISSKMGKYGIKNVEQEWTWDIQIKKLEKILIDCIST